jgi:ABC-type uncharacterized transport system YnjBCD substrate-binding protein
VPESRQRTSKIETPIRCAKFRAVAWKETRAISAGNIGSVALPSQSPHPNAARVFVNWLLSREGQTAFQRAGNTPINSEESMRIDISKETIAADARRIDGVKYLLAENPEFMDMTPIYELVIKPSPGKETMNLAQTAKGEKDGKNNGKLLG